LTDILSVHRRCVLRKDGVCRSVPVQSSCCAGTSTYLSHLWAESKNYLHPHSFVLTFRGGKEEERTIFCCQKSWTLEKWVEALSALPTASSPLGGRAAKTASKVASGMKKKVGWMSEIKDCVDDLPDSFVKATLLQNESTNIVHSEHFVYGTYTWALQVRENCNIRAGVVSCSADAGLPLSFSAIDEEDQARWSWYLETSEGGASLGRSPLDDKSEKEPQDDFLFGQCGDELTISLECKTGTLSFIAKRDGETYKASFGPSTALSRFRAAPEAIQASKHAAQVQDSGDRSEDSSNKGAPAEPAASVSHVNDGRRLFAFVELFDSNNSGCGELIISKILHESRVPAHIRAYFKQLSDDLQNSAIIRPIPDTEISYKGGSIEINGRCSAPKTLDKCATSVAINWPRTALPGPTKMEIRICPPPANSEACCTARYTEGIDKLNTGRLVGLVVDLRPHGLTFNVPVTIKIPHAVVLDHGEIWQNQFECVKMDDFAPVMGVPDSLFMCFDGRFDSRYGLLTVRSSGIFAIKASNYCRDVVHTKLYCQPSAALLAERKRLALHQRGPAIDSDMHEITSENFPVLFIDDKKLPMQFKLCGVFCQDSTLQDVLKAPLYDIPSNARIIQMTIQQCGYSLGVNLSLSHPGTLLEAKKFSTEKRSPELEVDLKYIGGPLLQKFEIAACAVGGDSDLLLKHPSYNIQRVEVSVKLRGFIGRPNDGMSQVGTENARAFIQRQRLSQYVSLDSIQVQIQRVAAKAHFRSVAQNLLTSDLVSGIVMHQSMKGLPSSEEDEKFYEKHAKEEHHCDLYIIRNPAVSVATRLLEFRVIESLQRQGWTLLDLTVPIFDGKHVPEVEYYSVSKCKATLIFVEASMLSDKLSPELPMSKMWVAALRAHGMIHQQKAIFGGDRIIPLCLGNIATTDKGVFPDDKSAWNGQIGERVSRA